MTEAATDAASMADASSGHPAIAPVLRWYAAHARTLPWRGPEVSAWAVLVSEFMLQQTPVARVLTPFQQWMERWPTPAALAAEPPAAAVRAWGRLGYPRRALRLHDAASTLVERHDGQVPADHDALLALPGVGAYTAAAVASFAFGQRRAVLDTNVRRALGRLISGVEYPPTTTTKAERRLASTLLPREAEVAARWAVAIMELGALVCVARAPRCGACPVAEMCVWRLSGKPPYAGPPRRGQTYAGTDRQVRGLLLAVLRESTGAVRQAELDAVWGDHPQRARALDALVADGLVEPLTDGVYQLPRDNLQ